MNSNTQRGSFDTIVTVIVFLFFALIAFIGYRLYVTSGDESIANESSYDNRDWQSVNAAGGGFSLSVPDGWRLYNPESKSAFVAEKSSDIIFSQGQDPEIIYQELEITDDTPFYIAVVPLESTEQLENFTEFETYRWGAPGLKAVKENETEYRFPLSQGKILIAKYRQGATDQSEVVDAFINSLVIN